MASAATTASSRRPRAAQARSPGGIRWDRVGRIALLGVLIVILLLYLSPTKHWIEQSKTAGEQKGELRELSDQNRKLNRRVRALRDPGALEREARRLGMVRRGERPYVVEGLPKP
jgi:cell division protein FtsB